MKKNFVMFGCILLIFVSAYAEEPVSLPPQTEVSPAASLEAVSTAVEYAVGIEDVLEVAILQPERLMVTVTVSPDGSITVPYIGSVQVKTKTLAGIQSEIQARLAEGYMKYPVVSVTLKESRSRKFFVYGEVMKPGTYLLNENATVLKAISMAGGFTKYGSSSRVKILRPRDKESGYEAIKVNINAVMNGSSKDDILLQPDDIIVVNEGMF